MDFNTYWQKMQPDARYDNRKSAAEESWNAHPEKHAAIERWLNKHGAYPQRNPYFFIEDFTVRSPKSEPKEQPVNWNGRTLTAGVEYVIAKYNGTWGTFTRDDVERFGLETRG